MPEEVVKFFRRFGMGKKDELKGEGKGKGKALSEGGGDFFYDARSFAKPITPNNPTTSSKLNPTSSYPRGVTKSRSTPILPTSSTSTSSNRPASKPATKTTKTNKSTTVSTSKTASKTKEKDKNTNNQSPNFELTPMSKIIAQSYKDIAVLRGLQAQKLAAMGAGGAGGGLNKGGERLRVKVVDFERIEENLRKFEQMYHQFLRYGSKYGTETDEVHLVAMLMKDSVIDRQNLGGFDRQRFNGVDRQRFTGVDGKAVVGGKGGLDKGGLNGKGGIDRGEGSFEGVDGMRREGMGKGKGKMVRIESVPDCGL